MSSSNVRFRIVQKVLVFAIGFPGILGEVAVLHVGVVGREETGICAAEGLSSVLNVIRNVK